MANGSQYKVKIISHDYIAEIEREANEFMAGKSVVSVQFVQKAKYGRPSMTIFYYE